MDRALWLDKDFYKRALKLTLPVALQNVLNSCLQIVDNIMVGQLGDAAVAGVGLAGQWAFLLNLIFFGCTSGATVLIAQFYGAKMISGVKKTMGITLMISMSVAILFTIPAVAFPRWSVEVFSRDAAVVEQGVQYLVPIGFTYILLAVTNSLMGGLRATEQVMVPLRAGLVGMGVNVVFNYILIFGKLGFPALGARGAALATLLSAFIQMVMMLLAVLRKDSVLVGRLHEMLPGSMGFVRRYLKVAFPVICNESLWALGMMVYSWIYAQVGTVDYAAYNILRNVETLAMAFFFGMGPACSVLVGNPLGRGDKQAAWNNAIRFLVLGPILSILAGVIIILSRGLILSAYKVSPEVIASASKMFIIFGALMLFRCFNYFSVVGVLRSGGDTVAAAWIDVGSLWFVGIPLMLLLGLVFHLPGYILLFAIEFGDVVKCIAGILRIRSRKWMNTLTHHEEGEEIHA